MNFDDLLKSLGEFGRYQKIRLFLICLVSLLCAWHSFNMVFVGSKPSSHHCKAPDVNLTDQFANLTQKDMDALFTKKKCELYDKSGVLAYVNDDNATYEDILERRKNVSSKECDEFTYYHEYFQSSIVSEFDLVCNRNWMRSTSKMIYFAGRLVGALGFGQLSDKFGRKPMFFIGLAMLTVVGGAVSLSPNIYVFMVFYFFQGAAQTGLFLVSYTMCTELVGPNWRMFAGFMSQSAYSVGMMTLAVIALVIGQWRWLEAAITIPVVLFAIYWWFLPESIRWLLSQNKSEEAKAIIRKVADVNKVSVTEDVLDGLCLKEKKKSMEDQNRKYTVLDLVKTWTMFKLSINVWFNWLVNALVYYGLSLGTEDLGGNPYLNFGIAGAVEIPAYIICIAVLNKLGRRKPLFVFMVCGAAGCIGSALVPEHLLELRIGLAMFGKFAITASYGIIYLYAAEVFPTVVRNIGMGVSSMSARIGGMLAPVIVDMSTIWLPLPMLVFGGLSVMAGALALLLPETAGKPLAQTIEELTQPQEGKGVELDVVNGNVRTNGMKSAANKV